GEVGGSSIRAAATVDLRDTRLEPARGEAEIEVPLHGERRPRRRGLPARRRREDVRRDRLRGRPEDDGDLDADVVPLALDGDADAANGLELTSTGRGLGHARRDLRREARELDDADEPRAALRERLGGLPGAGPARRARPLARGEPARALAGGADVNP